MNFLLDKITLLFLNKNVYVFKNVNVKVPFICWLLYSFACVLGCLNICIALFCLLLIKCLFKIIELMLLFRNRSEEVKQHSFFTGIDWNQVYIQKYTPPLIPPRGEVNAADAFDIGSFDEEDTKGIKLTEADQEQYRYFPLTISERWQQEVAETVFDAVNNETDKIEQKRKAKQKMHFDTDERESDCILHGYIKKLGGSFASVWQNKYAKLYPNRLELHTESGNNKPELFFMDQVEEVTPDFVLYKGEQCIQIRINDGVRDGRLILTNSDEIGLKEWACSLRSAHKVSQQLLGNMARKAGKIYGSERESAKPLYIIGNPSPKSNISN